MQFRGVVKNFDDIPKLVRKERELVGSRTAGAGGIEQQSSIESERLAESTQAPLSARGTGSGQTL